MNKLTILGDVHGKYRRLHEVLRQKDRYPHVVQLGDLGFNYDTLKNISPENFVLVAGNHDNYDILPSVPHYLGDFGYKENFGGPVARSFFYYRGAYSIDIASRTPKVDWWEEEQVKQSRFEEALELYKNTKPELMITHECPERIVPRILDPGSPIWQNLTSMVLDELFSVHKPKMWFFGHYHRSWSEVVEGCEFHCLNELEIYNL